MAQVTIKITWLRWLLQDMGVIVEGITTLYCGNQSAIHITKNPEFHERTKHIDIDYHFTHRTYLEGIIPLSYIGTASQIADSFTKSLPLKTFQPFLFKLGMIVFSSSQV
jgi:hypothetical protein